MAILEMSYSEIMDSNITGVEISIFDDDGLVAARFRNFDPEVAETYGNQTDTFLIPTVEAGLLLVQSNKEYHRIPLR